MRAEPRSKQWGKGAKGEALWPWASSYKYEPKAKNTPKKPPATQATSTPVGTARIYFFWIACITDWKKKSKLRYDHHSGNCNLNNVNNPDKICMASQGFQPITHGLYVSTTVLYQLSYEDPYTGSRPICWVHLTHKKKWNMEWRSRELRKYKSKIRYLTIRMHFHISHHLFSITQSKEHLTAEREVTGFIPGTGPLLKSLKITEKWMTVLPLLSKRLDLRVARMTT